MTYGSLFGGIRVADYAASLLGWDILFNSEIDPYCIRLGQQRFPGSAELGDIRTANFTQYAGMVDVLCGGFPCQDISNAGKKAGIDGDRSALWGHYFRAISEINPRYCLIENSNQVKSRGLDRILCDLASIGYDAEWEVISAAEYGASHIRERMWILAYPRPHRRPGILHMLKRICSTQYSEQVVRSLDGPGRYMEWFTERYGESPVWGIYDGFTRRFHVKPRLAGIGNSMYWPIPYTIFKALSWAETATEEEWLRANYMTLSIQ